MIEATFSGRINAALEKVKTILDVNKTALIAADVPHSYDDKYLLAEYLTNSALAATLNTLEYMGLSEEALRELLKWTADESAVSIRFKTDETCTFIKTKDREVDSPTVVSSVAVLGIKVAQSKEKTVTTYKDYYYKYTVSHEVLVYKGTDTKNTFKLCSDTVNCELVRTDTTNPPKPASTSNSVDEKITFLLQNIDPQTLTFKFGIDRRSEKCRTPRRNPGILNALTFFNGIHGWADRIVKYFLVDVFPEQVNHGYDISNKVTLNNIFVPILPLFLKKQKESKEKKVKEEPPTEEKAPAPDRPASPAPDVPPEKTVSSKDLVKTSPSLLSLNLSDKPDGPNLPLGDIHLLLEEQKRSLQAELDDIKKLYPKDEKLICRKEVALASFSVHIRNISQYYTDGVDYIEEMLTNQLIAAIGKELTPVDFTNYMNFHSRQLFKPEYLPRPFAYAVCRPDHYPEGVVSIEAQLDDGSLADPSPTLVRRTEAKTPMFFPIDSSTNIPFYGERYLHSMVFHQFSGQSGLNLNLNARARQFSSFILMVGTIISADIFDPKYAILVQNKDDLKIPLEMSTIPTPKEFRDAIQSLSPEQQRFAKAIRSMQLSSTLFGIVVIQIKPQIEKVLKLPEDALTKEIRLTQDIIELLVKYQIPPDQLSYQGKPEATKKEKVEKVKEYVKNMQKMIEDTKKQELINARDDFLYDSLIPPPPPPQPVYYSYGGPPPPPPMYSTLCAPPPPSIAYSLSLSVPPPPMAFSAPPPPSAGFAPPPPPPSAGPAPPPPPPGGSAAPPPPPPSSASGSKPPPPPSSASGSKPPPPPQSKDVSKPQPKPALDQKTKIYSSESYGDDFLEEEMEIEDVSKLPSEMDKKFDELDIDSALRPTIIKPGTIWQRKSQKGLLAQPTEETLTDDEQQTEKNSAFDLLDAITRSGALPIEYASLHVVVAATHCFDKTLLHTVIQDNINPIEKVERSLLIVASTIHKSNPQELIKDDQYERASTYSPNVFGLPQPSPSDLYKALPPPTHNSKQLKVLMLTQNNNTKDKEGKGKGKPKKK
eukprot:TRINITY_DN613_c0_g5_i1.p1 TRINITY_DN613_c0_g5~~TRINITY_DN613_c0_g5_i1.p1  ORF type:complete len:1046 (+),score=365.38 TRINITY_DN613_c0_g5_i1:48-3185(+)